MASQPLPPTDGWGPFQNWGAVEWLIGAAWTAGIAISAFVWRLATRIAILERDMRATEKETEKRHGENREDRKELIEQIVALRTLVEGEMRQTRTSVESLYRLMARKGDDL